MWGIGGLGDWGDGEAGFRMILRVHFIISELFGGGERKRSACMYVHYIQNHEKKKGDFSKKIKTLQAASTMDRGSYPNFPNPYLQSIVRYLPALLALLDGPFHWPPPTERGHCNK